MLFLFFINCVLGSGKITIPAGLVPTGKSSSTKDLFICPKLFLESFLESFWYNIVTKI